MLKGAHLSFQDMMRLESSDFPVVKKRQKALRKKKKASVSKSLSIIRNGSAECG